MLLFKGVKSREKSNPDTDSVYSQRLLKSYKVGAPIVKALQILLRFQQQILPKHAMQSMICNEADIQLAKSLTEAKFQVSLCLCNI